MGWRQRSSCSVWYGRLHTLSRQCLVADREGHSRVKMNSRAASETLSGLGEWSIDAVVRASVAAGWETPMAGVASQKAGSR